MAPVIVLDVETTGFGGVNTCVVELGAVAIDDNGDELGAFSSLIYPRVNVYEPSVRQALEVNRLDPGELYRAPKPWDVWAAFREWGLPWYTFAVTAFNKPFDMRMMDAEPDFASLPWADFCIMAEYRKYAKRQGYKKYKLELAADRLGVMVQGQPHRALTDARTAAGVWVALQRLDAR